MVKAAVVEPRIPLRKGWECQGQFSANGVLLGVESRNGSAHLALFSESMLPEDAEPIHASLRGYLECLEMAVFLEGDIKPVSGSLMAVENISIIKTGNSRDCFRLGTNIDAAISAGNGEVSPVSGWPCKLLNISATGACVRSRRQYGVGDVFVLSVQLLEDRGSADLRCEVVRTVDGGDGQFELGCRFLDISETEQQWISQGIYGIQLQKRRRA